MKNAILSIGMTSASVILAYILMGREHRALRQTIAIVWIAATAIAFLFVGNNLITLTLLAVLFAAAAAQIKDDAAALYLAIFAVLPGGISYFIPFPGLNYLIALDTSRLMSIILLAPIALKSIGKPRSATFRDIDWAILLLIIYTTLMAFRVLPFTSVMRSFIDLLLLVYLPYYAITAQLKTPEQMDKAMTALTMGCLILAGIGVISTLRSWNYYGAFSSGMGAFYDYRNGLLRVGATVVPSCLAFLCSAGIIYALRRRAEKSASLLIFSAAFFLSVLAAFATTGRGGWLGAMIAVAIYWIYANSGTAFRRLTFAGLVTGLSGVMYLIFTNSSLVSDEYGTVDYRAELLRSSSKLIAEYPLFGTANALESPHLARMVQGQGIIDLVNAYVEITVFYGLIGLGLFLYAYFSAYGKGAKTLNDLPKMSNANDLEKKHRRHIAALLGLLLGYLGLILTISRVSYIGLIGYILIALLAAQADVIRNARVTVAKPLSKDTDEPDEIVTSNAPEEGMFTPTKTPPSKASPSKAPYGARFVRRT